MQLPRGTFRGLKKGMTLSQLLHEMKSGEFSGFCNISGMSVPVTLVLKNGRVLLATYNDLAGEDAWNAVLSIVSEKGETELSDLTDAQIQLSIEFNPRAIVREGDIQLPQESGTIPKRGKTVPEKKVKIPVQQKSPPRVERDISIPERKPEDLIPAAGVPALTEPEHKPLHRTKAPGHADEGTDEDEQLVYEDLKVLDEMDLDSMSEKIRANCQVMVKKLNLEHLLERKNESRDETE